MAVVFADAGIVAIPVLLGMFLDLPANPRCASVLSQLQQHLDPKVREVSG